jgi:hypothetical protein
VDKPALNLLSLNATPDKSRILYHYCNQAVFWLILKNRRIWLSDIFTMRDRKELEWGREIFTKIINENPERFDDDFRFFTNSTVFTVDDHVRPFIASLSENGDLLSQWRAYSDDGKGFSLGLKAHRIYNSWGVRLKKIEYESAKQIEMVLQSLIELQDLWRKHPMTELSSMISTWNEVLREFAIDLCSFKHPSFFEEKEFRIVRVLLYNDGEYTDVGGHAGGGRTGKVPINTRHRDAEKITYIELPPEKTWQNDDIGEVILGPKNVEDLDLVRTRLESFGFRDFVVKKSASPYR